MSHGILTSEKNGVCLELENERRHVQRLRDQLTSSGGSEANRWQREGRKEE